MRLLTTTALTVFYGAFDLMGICLFIESDDPRCGPLEFGASRRAGTLELWGLGLHVMASRAKPRKA